MRGKIAMPVIAALLLLMAIGGNAAAAPPDGLESYDAGANGSALDLQVGLLDLQIAAGLTSTEVTSAGPAATADAVGLLLAGTEQTGAHAAAPDGEGNVEDCAAEIVLPPPLDLTDGTCIAGVSANAAIQDGAPGATAESDSLTLSLGGAELTEQLLNALLPVTDQVTAVLGDALTALNDVTCALPIADVVAILDAILPGISEGAAELLCSLGDVESVVDALIGSLADAASTTATITLAPNSSLAGATDEAGVLAAAVANGVTIDILPGIGPNGTSFLEVIVGASEASVVRDATTGEPTPVVTPAVAQVNVNGIGLDGLDIGLDNLLDPVITFVNDLVNQLATASPLSCGEPGPLAEIICLDAAQGFILDAAGAAAEGYDYGEGTVGARASALRLELLALVNGGEPAVSLSLAEAVAAANASPRQTPPSTAAPTTTQLPRTGGASFGGDNVLPLVLALGLGTGALAIRMRRRSSLG